VLVERALAGCPLGQHRDVWIVAAGKAAPSMARAAVETLGDAVSGGLMAAPLEATALAQELPRGPGRLDSIRAEHPVPGANSERAGRLALAVARARGPDESLLVLLSGGASSLMAVPAGGLRLDDKRRTNEILLRAGADIQSLNTVRKHLSGIKGGQLAACSTALCSCFALSDVVGDDLSVIASGPTVADPTTFNDALQVLRQYGGLAAYPPEVVAHLVRGSKGILEETPKPGAHSLKRSTAAVIGGRHDAMRGAGLEAAARGYSVVTLEEAVVGEARHAGRVHCARMLECASSVRRPACVVSSGETTVAVKGRGRGGRNQEFALACAEVLDRMSPNALLASVGTDGVDGPTDAAGALVDARSLARARALGFSADIALANNDAYAFFAGLDDLIRTGPTGTNVGDLQVALIA
jgi:hydroxypyruvate reductase